MGPDLNGLEDASILHIRPCPRLIESLSTSRSKALRIPRDIGVPAFGGVYTAGLCRFVVAEFPDSLKASVGINLL